MGGPVSHEAIAEAVQDRRAEVDGEGQRGGEGAADDGGRESGTIEEGPGPWEVIRGLAASYSFHRRGSFLGARALGLSGAHVSGNNRSVQRAEVIICGTGACSALERCALICRSASERAK